VGRIRFLQGLTSKDGEAVILKALSLGTQRHKVLLQGTEVQGDSGQEGCALRGGLCHPAYVYPFPSFFGRGVGEGVVLGFNSGFCIF
jgi:hypothetical protein